MKVSDGNSSNIVLKDFYKGVEVGKIKSQVNKAMSK